MKKYSDSAIAPSGKDIQFSLINQKEIELNFSYILDFITEIEDFPKNYKYPIFHILSFFFFFHLSDSRNTQVRFSRPVQYTDEWHQ